MDSIPTVNGQLLEVVDDAWRSEKLPAEDIAVPANELPDPEADSGDNHLTINQQENRWTDLALPSLLAVDEERKTRPNKKLAMELPNIGEHCSWQECNQLDFLPFICDNCKQIFCKEHYLTSSHDCKCLNEFFRKQEPLENAVFYTCNHESCNSSSPLELICPFCNRHYCIAHRHHGCRDELMNSERKKQQVELWKKPKEEFRAVKAETDKKVELALRKAATTRMQPLAQKVRLMKLKNKAIGEGKIPTEHRIYFGVCPPLVEAVTDYKSVALYTSKQWTVGRTIDLFAKKLHVTNKNNEQNEPKLRLFKLSDGQMISKTTNTVMDEIVGSVIENGDSLILDYIACEDVNNDVCIEEVKLGRYQSASV